MTRSVRFDDWVWNPNTLQLRNGLHIATLEPRVAKLFEYMLAHPGELLSRDQLVDTVWDGRVVSDEAVRRAVFNLRQAFAAGGADSYIRTVHRKGYVASFPKPVAVDQETPKELAPSPNPSPIAHAANHRTIPLVQIDADSTRVTASPPRLRLRPIILAMIATTVLVAVGLARMDAWWSSEPAVPHIEAQARAPATLAVLPFINFSKEETSELLANGLTEELFGTLERSRELRVTARSSAFQFSDENRDMREVGQRLGVRYVLSGSVRRSTDNVQVQAELVDTETNTPLWTDTYDRKLADWFALQQDIAFDVAREVQSVLQKEVVVATRPATASNAEAQLELLRARQLLITRSVADAEDAIEHLQRALTLDPNYALAYARLADAILIQAESTTGIHAARPVVTSLLDKALALDPELGEAHALRSRLTDDPAAAERDLLRGLELNPSYARGYEMLANLQAASPQRMDLALASIDRAVALDPLSPGNFHTKGMLMLAQGYYPEAAALERRALELNPKFRAAVMALGTMTSIEGDFAEAIDYTEQAVALDPRADGLRDRLMLLYLSVGDIDSARAVNTPSTVFGRLGISFAEGNIQHAADMIYSGDFASLTQIAPEFTSHIALLQAHADQNFERARSFLSAALPFTDSLPPDAIGWRLYAYANLVQVLAASGDETAASRLHKQIEERIASHEALFPRYANLYDQVRATLLAHAGRSDEACIALERTYAHAPRSYWRMVVGNPAFGIMHSVPCFQALLTRIEAHISAECVRIDEKRRAGQIPDRATAKPRDTAGAMP